ncbi:MAG TPA: hypothetical protein VG992_04825 [Candidatus Saccharimonadales bacterium]|nr:hypothetical protein [Candidatus Saccharimonadales bacterium]
MLHFLVYWLIFVFELYLIAGCICDFMYLFNRGFTKTLPRWPRPNHEIRWRIYELGIFFYLMVAWLPHLLIVRRRRLRQQTQH